MPLGDGAAHLAKEVCITELKKSYEALVQAASLVQAQNESLKLTARVAWIILNRLEGKFTLINSQELKLPPGVRVKAEVTDTGDLKVQAVIRGQEATA